MHAYKHASARFRLWRYMSGNIEFDVNCTSHSQSVSQQSAGNGRTAMKIEYDKCDTRLVAAAVADRCMRPSSCFTELLGISANPKTINNDNRTFVDYFLTDFELIDLLW